MSKRWWIVFGVAFASGWVCIAVGIRLSGVRSFVENVLPGAGVSLIVFSVAVLLIEGSLMTRESRVHRLVSMVSRKVAELNEKAGITLVREIGQYVASGLGSKIDLHGEERQDWKVFRHLLREVFEAAREVSGGGVLETGGISERDYLVCIGGVGRFVERLSSALGSHLEVHAELVDLVERQKDLESRVQEANRNIGIWDKKTRRVMLAGMGEVMIGIIEAFPRVRV